MALDKQEKTQVTIAVLAFLGLTLWASTSKAKPKRDTPFCPPDPQGRPQVWDAALGKCVLMNPDNPDPDFPDNPDACPVGQIWSPTEKKCVPIIFEPPVEPGNVDDIIKDFPEGGNFYQIRQGDIMGWGLGPGQHWNAVTYRLLSRELFLAAREAGLDDSEALAFAAQHRGRQKNQNELYKAIVCAAMNDYAYGTWGYDGKINHPGPHGRAIRLLTQHADNAGRLRAGLNMARTVSIKSPNDKGKANSNPVKAATPGGDNTYPLIWMPKTNRALLWSSKGATLQMDPEFANPPNWVTDRGVQDFSGSTLTKYGCGYGEIEFEE